MRTTFKLLDGRDFSIEAVTGRVCGSEKWRQESFKTNAHGTPENVAKTQQELWLKLEDGQERSFQFEDRVLPVKDGHVVTVFYGAATDVLGSQLLAILEHTSVENVSFLDGDVGSKTAGRSGVILPNGGALQWFTVLGFLSVIGIPLVLIARGMKSSANAKQLRDWQVRVANVISNLPGCTCGVARLKETRCGLAAAH